MSRRLSSSPVSARTLRDRRRHLSTRLLRLVSALIIATGAILVGARPAVAADFNTTQLLVGSSALAPCTKDVVLDSGTLAAFQQARSAQGGTPAAVQAVGDTLSALVAVEAGLPVSQAPKVSFVAAANGSVLVAPTARSTTIGLRDGVTIGPGDLERMIIAIASVLPSPLTPTAISPLLDAGRAAVVAGRVMAGIGGTASQNTAANDRLLETLAKFPVNMASPEKSTSDVLGTSVILCAKIAAGGWAAANAFLTPVPKTRGELLHRISGVAFRAPDSVPKPADWTLILDEPIDPYERTVDLAPFGALAVSQIALGGGRRTFWRTPAGEVSIASLAPTAGQDVLVCTEIFDLLNRQTTTKRDQFLKQVIVIESPTFPVAAAVCESGVVRIAVAPTRLLALAAVSGPSGALADPGGVANATPATAAPTTTAAPRKAAASKASSRTAKSKTTKKKR